MRFSQSAFWMIATGLILCLLSLGFYMNSPQVKSSKAQQTVSFRRLIEEKFDPASVAKSESSPAERIETQCVESFFPFLASDASNLAKTGQFPNLGECAAQSDVIKALKADYQSRCVAEKSWSDSLESQELRKDCFQTYFHLRAAAIGWLHRGDDISKIDNLSLLANILASSAMSDVDRFEAAAYRMKELAPGMYEPVKAALISQVMRAAQMNPETQSLERAEVLAKLEREISEALALRTDDMEVHEAVILAQTRMGERSDLMPQIIEDLRFQGQSGPALDYYEVSALWKAGNRSEALVKMEALAKAYPKQERFQETLSLLLKDPNGTAPKFSAQMSVSFISDEEASPQSQDEETSPQ
jgi:hypothetical protein